MLHAQALPDAGSLQQQLDRDRRPDLPPQRALPSLPAEAQPRLPTGGTAVTVKGFHYVGNTLLAATQLDAELGPFHGRSLDMYGLQQATDAVMALYRRQDRVVRAYLPRQDVTDGVVTIQIIEAVLGKVVIEEEGKPLVKPAKLQSMIESAQPPGHLLDGKALDRALLLADDLPGVAVSGTLRAGDTEGETDLVLKLSHEARSLGDVTLDNSGARSTGANRVSGSLTLNSPAGIGDLAQATVSHTEGSDYVRAAYSLPLGDDGLRVGLSASALSYRLVVPEFAALDAKGTSTGVGVDASYPLVRSREGNVYLNVNLDHKRFNNRSSGVTQSDYGVDSATVAVNANRYDQWLGGGTTSLYLGVLSGRLALGAPDANENAALNGPFSKLRYNLSRQQVITDSLSVMGSITGQYARKALDSSEKFYLGGPGGVRAYPANEAGGSSGEVASLELRQRLPARFIVYGFYDWGHVRNLDGAASYSLRGAGLGLSWSPSESWSLKATLAQRLGSNPNPTATGKDQDGSLKKLRAWLNASYLY